MAKSQASLPQSWPWAGEPLGACAARHLEVKVGEDFAVRRAIHPKGFTCPITLKTMQEPVMTCDGQVYERKAIAQWLKSHRTSPATGLALQSLELVPLHSLQTAIQTYLQQRPEIQQLGAQEKERTRLEAELQKTRMRKYCFPFGNLLFGWLLGLICFPLIFKDNALMGIVHGQDAVLDADTLQLVNESATQMPNSLGDQAKSDDASTTSSNPGSEKDEQIPQGTPPSVTTTTSWPEKIVVMVPEEVTFPEEPTSSTIKSYDGGPEFEIVNDSGVIRGRKIRFTQEEMMKASRNSQADLHKKKKKKDRKRQISNIGQLFDRKPGDVGQRETVFMQQFYEFMDNRFALDLEVVASKMVRTTPKMVAERLVRRLGAKNASIREKALLEVAGSARYSENNAKLLVECRAVGAVAPMTQSAKASEQALALHALSGLIEMSHKAVLKVKSMGMIPGIVALIMSGKSFTPLIIQIENVNVLAVLCNAIRCNDPEIHPHVIGAGVMRRLTAHLKVGRGLIAGMAAIAFVAVVRDSETYKNEMRDSGAVSMIANLFFDEESAGTREAAVNAIMSLMDDFPHDEQIRFEVESRPDLMNDIESRRQATELHKPFTMTDLWRFG